jgi:hypothetical protein
MMSARSIVTSAVAALATVAVLSACSVSASGNQSRLGRAGGISTTDPGRSMRLVSASEIRQSGAMTAEDAVRRLRPQLLQPRRSAARISMDYYTPLVYLDGIRAGGIESLSSIPAAQIIEFRFHPETEANLLFSGMHPGGAISLKTRS